MDDTINNYIRIGTDYFRKTYKRDRYGVRRLSLKKWKVETLKIDFGHSQLNSVPTYYDFTLEPDNTTYQQEIDGCYNLYHPFAYEPKEGTWFWTEKLLKHIFGEQYDLGLKYLQCLYLHPKQALPVLALVSKERQTGKSTFLDWITAMFGQNAVIIDAKNIKSEFNGVYARANIIGIEETFIDKSETIEKVKSISTQKTMTVNDKMIQHYSIPFYGKIIMNSNNEDKFIKIDEQEIRFFVRKVGIPKNENHNILNDMIEEIPAFVHYLSTLPKIDFSKSRMVFTAEELRNETLANVVEESRSWMYKEIKENLIDFFENHQSLESLMYASPKDIKERWFLNNNQVQLSYIRKVLRDEFKLEPSESVRRYSAFFEKSKTGKPYEFKKSDYVTGEVLDDIDEEIPF